MSTIQSHLHFRNCCIKFLNLYQVLIVLQDFIWSRDSAFRINGCVTLSQNYPKQVIPNGIERALNLNRSELSTVKQKSDENILTFISTINQKNPELFPVINQSFDILLEDEIMRDILSNNDIIKSKRQPPSLKVPH